MASVRQDLVFGARPGGDLAGDLYLPDGDGPHPVLVAAPGGAWLRGDKRQLGRWGRHLADNGVAVFIVDYRRSTDGPVFPGNVDDVLAAARFLQAQGATLGVDPARMGLLGASAGAHLASMAALAQGASWLAPGEAVDFKVLVAVYGVYDLFAHWQADLDKNAAPGTDPTHRMLGADPYENPQLYVDASPTRQIRYASNKLKALVVWGENDLDIAPAQSEAFARALRQARFFTRTLPVPGAGHFWFSEEAVDTPHTYAGRVAPPIIAFLKQHL